MTDQRQRQKVLLIGLLVIMMTAFLFVLYFANRKAGFHEDEYYSYYSTNYSQGWSVPDGEWLERENYENEFMVLLNERFQYGLVKEVQSWDVHPPMYYWVLHTVCSFWPEVFTKWQGLTVNIICYLLSIVLVFLCGNLLYRDSSKWYFTLVCCAAFAFSPAMLSSVMFIRMYSLLSMWILLSLFLHILAVKRGNFLEWKVLLPAMVVVYCGFLTHYYFMIFQFFLTASVCSVLFFVLKRWKEAILYGCSILSAIIMGIITFPACLGQMFRGQRGAEATSNFFDIKNTFSRFVYFLRLADRFWFGCIFVILFMVLVIRIIRYLRYKKSKETKKQDYLIWILTVTCLGYFFAVSKTALMLGDSSVRYILPVLGPSVLLLFDLFMVTGENMENKRADFWILSVLSTILLVVNLGGITHGKVLFLYPEDEKKVAFAKAHQADSIVYIYDANHSWKIWDSTNELLEYPRVYFVSDLSTEKITDVINNASDEIIVYIMGNTDEETQLQRLGTDGDCELIRQEQFCNVYRVMMK